MMAHELEVFADGRAAFATAKLDAWHRLGVVTADCMTAQEAMTTALLGGWNVRTAALQAVELSADGVQVLQVPDQVATVRTNPITGATDLLGVVGKDYKVIQNEECAELINLLVDESGAHFETAGSLRGGRQVFLTMKLPTSLRLAGVDDVDLYLAVTTSHDGSAALRIDATPVRVVCANTQRMALRASRGHYTFRHTTNVKGKIAQARSAIGLMWDYCTAFETEAQRMIDTELALAEFRKVCEQLWPLPDNPSTRTTAYHARRTATVEDLFVHAGTQANVRGTAWAGLQAVGEYLDHHAPAADAAKRAERVLTSGTVARLKQHAYELLTA
jgi:phage/plasmid-like protein (TIGR03299 family)